MHPRDQTSEQSVGLSPDQDLGSLVRVEKHCVLRHRVLNEEVFKVPQSKVGNSWVLGVGGNQDVTRLEVSMNNWCS